MVPFLHYWWTSTASTYLSRRNNRLQSLDARDIELVNILQRRDNDLEFVIAIFKKLGNCVWRSRISPICFDQFSPVLSSIFKKDENQNTGMRYFPLICQIVQNVKIANERNAKLNPEAVFRSEIDCSREEELPSAKLSFAMRFSPALSSICKSSIQRSIVQTSEPHAVLKSSRAVSNGSLRSSVRSVSPSQDSIRVSVVKTRSHEISGNPKLSKTWIKTLSKLDQKVHSYIHRTICGHDPRSLWSCTLSQFSCWSFGSWNHTSRHEELPKS